MGGPYLLLKNQSKQLFYIKYEQQKPKSEHFTCISMETKTSISLVRNDIYIKQKSENNMEGEQNDHKK